LGGGGLVVVLVRAIDEETEEWRREKVQQIRSGGKGGRNPKKTPTHARSSEGEKQRNEEGNTEIQEI